MRAILLPIPVILAVALTAGAAAAQATSANFRLTAGGFVGGGTTSASTTRALVGACVPTPAGGVSTSTNAREIGGPMAALPQAPAVQVLAQAVQTGVAGAPYGINADVLSGPRATLELLHRPGGSGEAGFQAVTMTTSNGVAFTGIIPAVDLTLRGVEVLVRARQNGLVRRIGVPADGTPFVVRASLSNQRGPALPDATFRMIGFPFDVDPGAPANVFEDDLGAPDSRQWRVGRWQPSTQSYAEYPGFGTVARGQGFWAIVRGGKSIGADGTSSLPDTLVGSSSYGKLVLQPGWNQIASPFAFSIDWSARIADPLGGVDPTAWAFDGTSYYSATQLHAFEGCFVFNGAAGARMLLLPYVEVGPGASAVSTTRHATAPAVREGDWSLQLSFSSGDRADRQNRIGAAHGAAEGWDERDSAEPPPNLLDRWLSAGFVPPVKDAPLLAADMRASGAAGWQFELRVGGNTAEPIRLEAGGLDALPAGIEALLIARADGRRWTLTPPLSAVSLPAARPQGDAYVLLVGSSDYVAGQLQSPALLPAQHALFSNRPNPFNPATAIRFALPSAQRARLEVLDLAGRRVVTLVDGEREAGYHEVRWDGRDSAGRSVASGTYLYRLVAGSFAQSRKMLLVK